MYNNSLISPYSGSSSSVFQFGDGTWTLVAFVLALVGCFLAYFLFVTKKGEPKEKFLAWLKKFLSFDTMLIEAILKISYLFFAIFITLASFGLIGTSFLAFLIMLVGGNLIVRLAYEASLILVMLWKNTTEIKNKMK